MDKHEFLLSVVMQRLDDYRYSHVLSVFNECQKLSQLFSLSQNENDDLLTAAILHDITKPLQYEEQIKLASELQIDLSRDDLASPAILHSITGAHLIKKDFPEYVNKNICSAVLCHTTGKADMNIVEKLLYLADYIEPTRKFADCVRLRNYFYNLIGKKIAPYEALDSSLILSFDLTISLLIESEDKIHPQTVISRNYLIK